MKPAWLRLTLLPLLFINLFFAFDPEIVRAEISLAECEQKIGKGQLNLEQIQQCQEQFDRLYSQASTQKKSLQAEISKFNAAMALTETKIVSTAKEITSLEKEIGDLSVKITKSDYSLDQVTTVLIRRIVGTYKAGKLNPVVTLLAAGDLMKFINHNHYLQIAQEHDRKLMFEMESVRTNFESQKNLKEEKQEELEEAKERLASQKLLLDQQRKVKQNLLSVTQGNENKYQQLLNKALAEIASLKRFTQNKGGGLVPPQNSPDGWYYSQRDERWGRNLIGSSTENILDVGCLISSVAMVFTFYGQKVTPADIAANSSYFFAKTAYMNSPWPTPGGKSQASLGSMGEVDNELNAGRPVIVHLNLGGDGHFVVLKKKDGGDYIMHDPWEGYDKKLTDFYAVSSIDKRVVYR